MSKQQRRPSIADPSTAKSKITNLFWWNTVETNDCVVELVCRADQDCELLFPACDHMCTLQQMWGRQSCYHYDVTLVCDITLASDVTLVTWGGSNHPFLNSGYTLEKQSVPFPCMKHCQFLMWTTLTCKNHLIFTSTISLLIHALVQMHAFLQLA